MLSPQEPEDGGQGPPGGGQPKQPVEFDQAISYVNKIKVSSCAAGSAMQLVWGSG
jgi:histone deacetylase complex regulatory component SIN3